MFGGVLLSFALLSDCADFLKGIPGEPSRAIIKSQLVTSAELASIFRLPAKMDGLVAILFQGKNLRVYGVVNATHDAFEKIEIWGFERFPRPIISVDGNGVVKKFAEDSVVVTALVEVPRLEKLLIDKRILPQFAPDQKWKLKYQTHEVIDAEVKAADRAPVWGDIYRTLHENRLNQEFKNEVLKDRRVITIFSKVEHQNATVPEPENRELRNIDFGGWLPEHHSATAILQQRRMGTGFGLLIFLHPRLKSQVDPAFPGLEHRIRLERRFEISWLGVQNPTVIETEPQVLRDGIPEKDIPPQLSDNLIMVFEAGAKLPQQLPFFRLDPETGLRISGRQILALNLKR